MQSYVNPKRSVLRRYIDLQRSVVEVIEAPAGHWEVRNKRLRTASQHPSKSAAQAAAREWVAKQSLRAAWHGIFRGAPFPNYALRPYRGGAVDAYVQREWPYAVYAAVTEGRC